MPTYEYKCDACGYSFTKEQRITEKPLKKCPNCGKMKARRMINGGGFILKGGGWESDLYSGPSNRSGGSKKSESKSESKSSESKSSESGSKSKKKASKKAASAD
ncbi:MAG: zinc ribbon domain-containing protein [Myxococcota bacterium]